MFEKLLLSAALTLSLHIFAGVSSNAKFPKTLVFRSGDRPVQTQKLPLISVPAGFKSNVKF